MNTVNYKYFVVIIDGIEVGISHKITLVDEPGHIWYGFDGAYGSTPKRTLEIELDSKPMEENQLSKGLDYIQNRYGRGPLERPDWDNYFLRIADAVSRRGDCTRRQIGAVVVDKKHRIAGTGYNGVPPGKPGCVELPCDRTTSSAPCPGYSDCRSVHAEANALLYTDRKDCIGGTLYISDSPCESCLKLIKAARIKRVVWPKGELKL